MPSRTRPSRTGARSKATRRAAAPKRKPTARVIRAKTAPRARPLIDAALHTPWELEQELRNDPRVRAVYASMPPSHRRAYVEFIEEAKRPETRVRRVQQALRMMAQWGEERAARSTRKR